MNGEVGLLALVQHNVLHLGWDHNLALLAVEEVQCVSLLYLILSESDGLVNEVGYFPSLELQNLHWLLLDWGSFLHHWGWLCSFLGWLSSLGLLLCWSSGRGGS